MERTAIKHVDTVLTTQHVIMRTVSVHKAVQLVTRHTRVIQVSNMRVLAANSNLLYRLWDKLLHITNKRHLTVEETDSSVKENTFQINRTVPCKTWTVLWKKRTVTFTNRNALCKKRNKYGLIYHRRSINYDRSLYCLIFWFYIKLSMI